MNELSAPMACQSLARSLFRIGEWTVEPMSNRLENGEETRYVRHKAMELLVFLAERHGQVVPREALVEALWDGNDAVALKAITNTLWTLRQSLGDTAEKPVYIETIAKRGYRLLPPVVVMRATPGGLHLAVEPEPEIAAVSPELAEPGAAPLADAQPSPVEPLLTPLVTPEVAPPVTAAHPDGRKIWRRALAAVLGSAALVVAFLLGKDVQGPPLPVENWANARAQVLANTSEVELGQLLSPDRRRVLVGTFELNSTANILLSEVATPQQNTLLFKVQDLRGMAWSPDGESFAVLRGSDTRGHVLERVRLSDLSRQVLAEVDAAGVWGLAWSADGKTLWLPHTSEEGPVISRVDAHSGERSPWRPTVPGRVEMVLAAAPEGNDVLIGQLHQARPQTRILRVSPDGQETEVLKDETGGLTLPVHWWHPDRVLLAVTAGQWFEEQVHELDMSTRTLRPLGIQGRSPQRISASQLLLIRGSQQTIFLRARMDESSPPETLSTALSGASRLAVLADGTSFYSVQRGGVPEIWRRSAQGQLSKLASGVLAAVDPQGQRLIYRGGCASGSDNSLCELRVDTGAHRVLYASGVPLVDVAFIERGKRLVFVEPGPQRSRLHLLDLVEGHLQKVEVPPSPRTQVSEDGAWVYWGQIDGRAVSMRALAGGEVREWPLALRNQRAWHVQDGKLWQISRDPSGKRALYRSELGGPTEKVRDLPDASIWASAGLNMDIEGRYAAWLQVGTLTSERYELRRPESQ